MAHFSTRFMGLFALVLIAFAGSQDAHACNPRFSGHYAGTFLGFSGESDLTVSGQRVSFKFEARPDLDEDLLLDGQEDDYVLGGTYWGTCTQDSISIHHRLDLVGSYVLTDRTYTLDSEGALVAHYSLETWSIFGFRLSSNRYTTRYHRSTPQKVL